MTLLSNDFLSLVGIALSFGIFLSSVALYAISTIIYNLFFHPLRHIPGPWLARSTPIPLGIHMRSGKISQWVQQVHAQYGDVVRVAPTEVSFISGDTAWPAIYGHRTGKYKDTGPYAKDRSWYPLPANGIPSILESNEADHSRLRRNLAHAFSDKALRAQEPLLVSYTDLLIQKLSEQANRGLPVDIMRWYNFATFDIIADLCFGEPLYCLKNNDYHVWVNLIFGSIKALPLHAISNRYFVFRCIDKIRSWFKDLEVIQRAKEEFFAMTSARVSSRIERKTERPDFFTYILQNQEKDNRALTRGEMDANAVVMMIAGSETTATTLSGLTYLLLQNKAVYARLVHDIRNTFTSTSEITLDAVGNLPYLLAVLQEGLRYYPPVPTGFPRTVPGAGQEISGHFIAGGTAVYVSQHATNHSKRNFANPQTFAPERWLEHERPIQYKNDKRETLQPFSFGPRNCLGKNLAYAELRLVLTKMLFHFDIELVQENKTWMSDQLVFAVWEKPALNVKLTPVQR